MDWTDFIGSAMVLAGALGGVCLGAVLQKRSSLTSVKRTERKEAYIVAIRSADDLFELVKTNLPHTIAAVKDDGTQAEGAPIGPEVANSYVREFRIQRRMLRIFAPTNVADGYDKLFRCLNNHWWIAGLPKPLETQTAKKAVEDLVDQWAPLMEAFVELMGADLGPESK